MARMNQAQFAVDGRVIDRHDLISGQAKHRINPGITQGLGEGGGSVHGLLHI